MLFATPLFALLTACTPTPSPTDAATDAATDVAETPSKVPGEKNGSKKAKKGSKTAKTAKTAKGDGKKTAEAPLGVAGPVTGTLALVDVPAAPAAGGTVPTTTARKTSATLALTFADGQSSDVSLGTMDGVCAEITPVPIGTDNKTPLWSVRCTAAEGKEIDVHVVQNEAVVSVLRAVAVEGQPTTYKPLKRVRLADGAALQKG